jgi:hypothetical protein
LGPRRNALASPQPFARGRSTRNLLCASSLLRDRNLSSPK